VYNLPPADCTKKHQPSPEARGWRGLAIHPELIHRLIPRNGGKLPANTAGSPWSEFSQIPAGLVIRDQQQYARSLSTPWSTTPVHKIHLWRTMMSGLFHSGDGKPVQKITSRRQGPPMLGCSEVSRACPQGHPPAPCITPKALIKKHPWRCRPRADWPAA
jgi:hypothetical protein